MNFPLTRPRISCVFLFFCGEITNQYLCLIKQAQLSRFHSCFSCINFARVLLERLGVGVGGDCPRTKPRWADGAWGGDPSFRTPLRGVAATTLTCGPRRGEENQSGHGPVAGPGSQPRPPTPGRATRSRTAGAPAASGGLRPVRCGAVRGGAASGGRVTLRAGRPGLCFS